MRQSALEDQLEAPPTSNLVLPQDQGRYYIGDRPLGIGSSGVVYAGFDHATFTPVAFKSNLPRKPQSGILRETKLALKAHSGAPKNTPQIYRVITGIRLGAEQFIGGSDSEQDENAAIVVMSWCEQEPLLDVVNANHFSGDLRPGLQFGVDLFSALDKVHSAGVVHGDLGIHNVLCTPPQSGTKNYEVVIVDFENGSLVGDHLSDFRGKESITAPERWAPHMVTPQSDLYSAACTMYLCICKHEIHEFGSNLFKNGSGLKMYTDRVLNEIPNWNTCIELRKKLQLVLSRCLAFNPTDRPRRAQIVANELQIILEQDEQSRK